MLYKYVSIDLSDLLTHVFFLFRTGTFIQWCKLLSWMFVALIIAR